MNELNLTGPVESVETKKVCCSRCGRKITKINEYNGGVYGRTCLKKVKSEEVKEEAGEIPVTKTKKIKAPSPVKAKKATFDFQESIKFLFPYSRVNLKGFCLSNLPVNHINSFVEGV